MITEIIKIECPYCQERVKIIVASEAASTGGQVFTIYGPYIGTAADPKRR